MNINTLFVLILLFFVAGDFCFAQSQNNKGYEASVFSEMGNSGRTVILSNTDGKDLASQLIMDNTVYEIRYDFDLSEKVGNIIISDQIKFEGKKWYRNKEKIHLTAGKTIWVPRGCFIMNTDFDRVYSSDGKFTPAETTTVYIVSTSRKTVDYVLQGHLTIPKNSVLKFNGGHMNNCILYGQGTVIEAPETRIFGDNVSFAGEWNNNESHTIWFGDSVSNTIEDQLVDRSYFIYRAQQIISDKGGTVKTINGNLYELNNTFALKKNVTVEAYRRGYKMLIINGDEGGAVNEFVHKAFYHPAIVIDCDNRINSEVQLASNQYLSGHSSLLFRMNGESKYNLSYGNAGANAKQTFSLENLIQNKASITVFPSNNIAYGSPGVTNYVNADPGVEHLFYGRVIRKSRNYNTPQIEIRQALDSEGNSVSFRSDVNPNGTVTAEIGKNMIVKLSSQLVEIRTPIKCATFSTSQMKAIISPEVGMMVFNTTIGKPAWYNGENWVDAVGDTIQ